MKTFHYHPAINARAYAVEALETRARYLIRCAAHHDTPDRRAELLAITTDLARRVAGLLRK